MCTITYPVGDHRGGDFREQVKVSKKTVALSTIFACLVAGRCLHLPLSVVERLTSLLAGAVFFRSFGLKNENNGKSIREGLTVTLFTRTIGWGVIPSLVSGVTTAVCGKLGVGQKIYDTLDLPMDRLSARVSVAFASVHQKFHSVVVEPADKLGNCVSHLGGKFFEVLAGTTTKAMVFGINVGAGCYEILARSVENVLGCANKLLDAIPEIEGES